MRGCVRPGSTLIEFILPSLLPAPYSTTIIMVRVCQSGATLVNRSLDPPGTTPSGGGRSTALRVRLQRPRRQPPAPFLASSGCRCPPPMPTSTPSSPAAAPARACRGSAPRDGHRSGPPRHYSAAAGRRRRCCCWCRCPPSRGAAGSRTAWLVLVDGLQRTRGARGVGSILLVCGACVSRVSDRASRQHHGI